MTNLEITEDDISNLETEFEHLIRPKIIFDQSRRRAIINSEDVHACPGSGKTTMVAAKLILLAKKWTETRRGICVLTHTNVAVEEILKLLLAHPAGHKLQAYPHFIGTIQEFVNRFLGLPYLRSKYEFKRFSENNEAKLEVNRAKAAGFAIDELCRKLYRRCNRADYQVIEEYLSTLFYVNKSFDLGFFGQNGILISTQAVNRTDTYVLLEALKEMLNQAGIFQFRDMYVFAEKIIEENPAIIDALQMRFPYVIIDEMQDTQKFQDDLTNQLFNNEKVVLQRFGDPDQAIFDGMGRETPNESYNKSEGLTPIADTRRFGNDIATKIKGLSYNRLFELQSSRDEPDGGALHTVFLYSEENIEQVIPSFGDLVFETLKEEQRKIVKVVGAVGRENAEGLTIKHYWNEFDKARAIKSFKVTKLIHSVKKCSEHLEGNVSDNYELLLQGIIDLLRKANKKTKNKKGDAVYYNKTSLISDLQSKNKYETFRTLFTSWIIGDFPDEDIWNQQISDLLILLGIQGAISQDVRDFVTYENCIPPENENKKTVTNTFSCNNGLNIEVSTIHAIKGETHDATLILETKFHEHDISTMLDFIVNETLEAPIDGSRKSGFMRRLYVAASRPRHLLCLAIHKDHITPEQMDGLIAKDWEIKEL